MKGLRKLLCFFVPLALAIALCFGFILPLAINGELWNDSNSITSSAEESPSNTGASTADQSLKGGAIFMQPGSSTSSFDMNGGEISNSSNKYGGAIFISTGTAFTMTAGSIHDCQATYGGAIYVQAGATCTITGGAIHDCTATYGPAIFVERGAIFSCTSPDINPDEIYDCNTSLGVVPDGVIVKRNGTQLSSGASLSVGDVLEITFAVKNDYYMSFDVEGATKSGTNNYVVNKSVQINYTEVPATLDKLKFVLKTDHYEVSRANDNIAGEVVIPTYHDNVLVTTIPRATLGSSGTGFAECINMTSVLIPSSVSSITTSFDCCVALESIKVSANNTTFTSRNKSNTECNCIINTSTNTLVIGCNGTIIPDDGSVTIIGENAFYGSGISTINIPVGVTDLGRNSFSDCPNLDKVTMKSVINIGYGAFQYSAKLSTVELGSNIKTIGSHAFYSCTGLYSIGLPNGLQTIAEGSFSDCTSLKTIEIPGTVSTISESAFSGCENLNTVRLGYGITVIDTNAFADSGLLSVSTPSTLTTIGSGAFMRCYKLMSADIYVTGAIGRQAFMYCESLSSVTIGSGVSGIESQAFYGCSMIHDIIVQSKPVYSAIAQNSASSSNGYLTYYLKTGCVIQVLSSIDTGNSYLNSSSYFSKATGSPYNTYTRK